VIAEKNNIDPNIYNQLFFNESYFEDNMMNIDECKEDIYYPDNTFQNIEYKSFTADIILQLQSLKQREMDTIRMYFGINREYELTLQEIAEEYGLTRERVRQIKENAIKKLKHKSRKKVLSCYLNYSENNDDYYCHSTFTSENIYEQSFEEKEMVRLINDYVQPRRRKTNYKNISKLIRDKIYKYIVEKKRPCLYSEIADSLIEELPDINPNYFPYAFKTSSRIIRVKPGLYGLVEWKDRYQDYIPKKEIKLPKIEFKYTDFYSSNNVDLGPNEQLLLTQFEKKEGLITSIWLNSLMKVKQVDLIDAIRNINTKIQKKYSKDLIIYDEDTLSWEIDAYFNISENWRIRDDVSIVKETSANSKGYMIHNTKEDFPEYVQEQSVKIKHIFDHTVTTYKFYWFLSLLTLVEQEKKEATFYEMAALMCAHAWKDVLIFNCKYNKQDNIPKAVREIYLKCNLEKNVCFDTLYNYLFINEEYISPLFDDILRIVPYRFLSIFMDNLSGIKDCLKNNIIYQNCQNLKYMYCINSNKISINRDWYIYLSQNRENLRELIMKNLKRNISCIE
jgi:DNA-binding CsgD family transcriptional regulator